MASELRKAARFCCFNVVKSMENLNLKSRKLHSDRKVLCSHSVLLLFFCRLCLLFLSLLQWSPRSDFTHLRCIKGCNCPQRTKEGPKHLVDLIKTHWDLSKLCANQQEVDCPSSGNTEPILQSTKARASSLLEPAMKVSLDAEPMGRECSWCWVLLKQSRKRKSRLPPIQIPPVLRHVHENIFLPPKKKTWRNTLCCIFIPLTSPMSQLISYWLMQNLEPSGEINTTILTVCRLRTGKSTCGKKENDFFLQSWGDVTSSCQQFHFNQHVHRHVKMWNKCRWRLQSPFLDLVNQSAQACPEKLSN